jgi:putative membrane protein
MRMPTSDPAAPDIDPRVPLAAERTLLAWIRTGLAFMGFGFVVARFGMFMRELAAASGEPLPDAARRGGLSLVVGTLLVLVGVTVNILAAAQHLSFIRRLRRGEHLHALGRFPTGIVLSILLALIGIVMAVYLVWVR